MRFARIAAGDEVRTVIAGYHWFTDWGRDTMISLEGLTLSTGPFRRGRVYPADLRSLREGRPDPEHVSRKARRRASITLPTRLFGSFTRSDRYVAVPATATLQLILPKLVEIIEPICCGTRFGIRSIPPTDCSPGCGRLSANLDGRQGGRLGRHAAPRQGRRDQRALVQRPLLP